MKYIPNFPYSVLLDVKNNIHKNYKAQIDLPENSIESDMLNQAIKKVNSLITSQSELYNEILGELGVNELDFSIGSHKKQNRSQVNNKAIEKEMAFVKNFRQALAVLSTSESREERLKALEILLSLTENELSNWDYKNNTNNKNLQIMAHEVALIQQDAYARKIRRQEYSKNKSTARTMDQIKKSNEFKLEEKEIEILKELNDFIYEIRLRQIETKETLSFEEANKRVFTLGNPSKYLSINFIRSRGGYFFEPIINEVKTDYLQSLLPKDSGWEIQNGVVPGEIRYQYTIENDKIIQKKSHPVLDRIDEWITLSKKGDTEKEDKWYGFAFSDKLRVDLSSTEIQKNTSFLNILDILKNSNANYVDNFIFLALNTAHASSYSQTSTQNNLIDFVKKIFASFVYDLVFNPKNFFSKILENSGGNSEKILYLTQTGTTYTPSFIILSKTLEIMQGLTNQLNNPAIQVEFNPDTTSAENYNQQLLNLGPEYKEYVTIWKRDGKTAEFSRYTSTAWQLIANQVIQNTKVKLALDIYQLNNILFST